MSIPDLHEVVLAALDLHASYQIEPLELKPAKRRLVVASGNALPTGRILFADEGAHFSDEGQYERLLDSEINFDSAVLISASGTKHAPNILQHLLNRGHSPYLITCDRSSPAAALLPPRQVIETRKLEEPITYNTSTYLGMILSKTREDPATIRRHLLDRVEPLIPDFARYAAFYLMLVPEHDLLREMFVTKFDKLFGGRVNGRCYTSEQTLHAKTVVPWDRELFISFGSRNESFGSERLTIPLPEKAGFAATMAAGYYVIGRLQEQFPPWFKQHAEGYAETQLRLFTERS